MSATAAASSLTRHRSFVRFWCARTFTNGAFMMQGVAVGWQIYALTNDPLDLGLVGLVQFFPLLATSIIAGQVLDLFDRRAVASACQVGKALAALALAVGSVQGWLDRESMFAILFVSGTARAFEIPTMHAILPGVVPMALLPRAIAASASAQQTAVICGPSLGGLLYGLGPATVYATCTAIFIAASVLISFVEMAPRSEPRRVVTLETASPISAAIRFSSAPSRSICSPSCSAASRRCCRSTRATSCTPDPGRSACCARRPPSARSPYRSCWRTVRSPAAPATSCSPRSDCSGWRACCSDCRPRSGCRSWRW